MPHEVFSYMDMMHPMGAPAVQMNPVTMCVRAPCPQTENAPNPPPIVKPKFMPSYVNTGNATYTYPKCKTGYVAVMTNAVPPNNQSCMDPLEVKWNKDHGIVF